MSNNINSFIVDVKQAVDASPDREQRPVPGENVRIELQVSRHILPVQQIDSFFPILPFFGIDQFFFRRVMSLLDRVVVCFIEIVSVESIPDEILLSDVLQVHAARRLLPVARYPPFVVVFGYELVLLFSTTDTVRQQQLQYDIVIYNRQNKIISQLFSTFVRVTLSQ